MNDRLHDRQRLVEIRRNSGDRRFKSGRANRVARSLDQHR
jgi:hypothetical protein